MQVSSATSTSTSSAASASSSVASATTVDYNAFLQLLVQEMKNQDPTQPSDPTQYLGQLASFSNVEQVIQTNNKLDSLLTASSFSQADGVIGKTVTSADGTQSGQVVSVALGSGGAATATLADGSTLALGSGVTVTGS